MIGRSVLLVACTGIACGLTLLAVIAVGSGLTGGAWALLPAGIAAAVAAFEWQRIKREPVDAERPGIVPGDE